MRLVSLCLAVIFAGSTLPALAENPTPHSGTEILETGKPFGSYVEDLKKAIRANGMGIVAEACATCGAESIGVMIPGNRVIMVFSPRFAVRMLEAIEAGGIEAPLRLYVTERPDAAARLTYRLPTAVFGVYQNEKLDAMAAELDGIVAEIVADSKS